MKKTFQLVLVALFAGLTSLATAQVNLDELAAAVGESPENAASLAEAAVRSSPDQALEISERLIAAYPELTEEIVFGVLAGLPELTEDDLEKYLLHIVRLRPALSSEIVVGARRATTPAMEPVITSAVRTALQHLVAQRGLGILGRTSRSAVPGDDIYDPNTHQIISPSQNNH